MRDTIQELESRTQRLATRLRESPHKTALRELWSYPGRHIADLEYQYNLRKNEVLRRYVSLAREIYEFRRDLTEKKRVSLPDLGALLRDLGKSFKRFSQTPEYITGHVEKKRKQFLASEAVEDLPGYQETSSLDSDLVFFRVDDESHAFIVSEGYLRPYLLSYDHIDGEALLKRYRERIVALGEFDAFLYLTKDYGPVGPVMHLEELEEAFPSANHILHDCTSPAHSRVATPAGPVRRLCVLYDLVFSGGGIANAVGEFTARLEEKPHSIDAVVLSSEASEGTEAQRALQQAGVQVHEIFPFEEHKEEYGVRDYPESWEDLGRPVATRIRGSHVAPFTRVMNTLLGYGPVVGPVKRP